MRDARSSQEKDASVANVLTGTNVRIRRIGGDRSRIVMRRSGGGGADSWASLTLQPAAVGASIGSSLEWAVVGGWVGDVVLDRNWSMDSRVVGVTVKCHSRKHSLTMTVLDRMLERR